MALLDTIFIKKHHPIPLPYIDNNLSTIKISVFSSKYLPDDVLDVIFSVVKADLVKQSTVKEISKDITTYTGTNEEVHVLMVPEGIKVIIGKI